MNEKDLIILPMDAVVYLAKHFSIHTHQLSMLIRNNVFKQKDPMVIIRDMESAEYFYKEYQKEKQTQARTTPKKPVFEARAVEIRKGFPVTITEPNGQKITFHYKREINSYFAARYKRKASTINHLNRNALVFWTNDILQVVKNIPRADAYYYAYLRNAPRFRPEDIAYRKRPQKNRPAYDGGYHMDKRPKLKVKQPVNVPSQKTIQQRKKKFPYHTLPPLAILEPFAYDLDYVYKDELERFGAERKAIQYMADSFSLKPKSIEKHLAKNIYFSEDPILLANNIKRAYEDYADYLHNVKEGARLKSIQQNKAARENLASSSPEFSVMIQRLQQQRSQKAQKMKDAEAAIKRLHEEVQKEANEISVLDGTIASLTEAKKIFQP